MKISKTSQMIGAEGQKYAMDFELRCPNREDRIKAKAAASAQPAASGKEKDK